MKFLSIVLYLQILFIGTLNCQESKNLKKEILRKIKKDGHEYVNGFEFTFNQTKQNIDHNNVKSKKYIFSPKKYATYWFYLMSSKEYNNDIELSITLEKFLTKDKEKTCTEKSYNILDSATDKNITVKKIEFKCGGIYKFMMEFKERKAGYAIMMVAKKLKTTEYP